MFNLCFSNLRIEPVIKKCIHLFTINIKYINNPKYTYIFQIDHDDTINGGTFVPNDAKQMWEKGNVDDEGYFTITNSYSKKVMTAISEDKLESKGILLTTNMPIFMWLITTL